MNWQPLIEFVVSVGYGPLSSLVPIFAVPLAVPAARMSVILFGVAVLLGRMVLFLAIDCAARSPAPI